MADRNQRKKASDVFRETTSFFGSKVPFSEAFPTIEHVKVRVKETGYGVYEPVAVQVYTESSLGEYIDCRNPVCYKGGFSVGIILRDMVSKKQEDFEGTEFCRGYEGSPKGKRRYRSCTNSFEVRIHIEYRDESI